MSSKEEKMELREELDEEMVMSETRSEVTEKREGHCYCGKERNLNIAELLCASCSRWYHESCIGYQLGKLVPFMLNYVFLCKNCSSTGLENFKKSQAAFPQMCITAIANLMQASIKEGAPKSMFSKDREIVPFIDNHWEGMTTMPRRVTQSWHSTIQRALQKDLGTLFVCEEATVEVTTTGHPLFGLNSLELTQIKPNYEAMIRGGSLKITDVGITHVGSAGSKGRSAKRKVEVAGLGPGKKRSESTLTKLPTHGYPLEHPFNKDGYRYILAEPDPHAPFRQEFDESNDWAGKPIPGWLYRTLSPSTVLLALHDRAPQLKISEDRLAVTGEKGYCMVRATHAVSRGNWYWEATVEEMPEGAATRIGFAQEYANLQAPCGYDKFGYSWRSRKGTAFNESRGRHFGGPYCEGDVIGFQIILPHSDSVNYIPPTYKDRPLVKFKSHLYYEEKDKVQESLKNLRTLPGSKIVCYKNGLCLGEAFTDVNAGAYFPAISIHKSATVSVNFGPSFKHELPEGARGMYEKAEEAIIEQTAADLLFLTENDGKLRLDLWSDQGSSTGPLGRWLRDLRPGKSSASPPQGPARSNPAYHSEGKGARRRNKDRRRLSFNEVDKGNSTDGTKAATPMSSPPSIFTYLQQAAPQQPPKLLDLPPSRSESSASLPSSSSGLSSWGSTQDAARTGWEQAPTPPVRDASSLKGVRYGPGHEKFPSWPVPAAADTPPAVRQCCHNTGGSHRSKSWTEQTDYPKENCPHYYTRPYMRRQASVSATTGFTLKTVLERSEAAMMFAEPPEVRRGQLPTLDREGKPIGDLRYLAPSPPERDTPGQKAEPQVPHLTQAEVEEYARTYDAALLRQQSSEFLTAPMHQSQGSYAQSEGYHSYVSSTDSTNTPFLDRLRQESSTAWTEDEDVVDVQGSTDTLSKWRGSLSDMSVTSSSLGTSTSGMSMRQLIAHSSRVQTPQRHMSESVLYLAPQQPTASHWSSRVQRNNALNSSQSLHQSCANRSPPPQGALSVAERVHELERQSLSVSTSSLAPPPSCRSRVADPAALRAFQKKALLSYYERQQQHWRSEPHLSPPPAPPRTSASSDGWRRHEPQMAVPMTRDMSDKHIPAEPEVLSIRKPAIPAPEVKHIREPSLVIPDVREPSLPEPRHSREPSLPEPRHSREPSLPEPRHVREPSLPEPRHIREPSLPEPRHIRESSLTGSEPKHARESSLTGSEPKHVEPKYMRELSVPETKRETGVARRHSHSSNSSLSSSEMPTSPSRKHVNGSPKMSETSSDLLGPLIVGPSISLDDWVPERPPKKPHLRSASFQQQQQRLRLVPCPLPRRSSTPEPPPPTPPPVLEDEVFHCDLPLPPPPPELVEDWTLEGSGHAKSTTNLAGPTTYLRRSNTMESMEGSYKRTPDPCAALATTLPVFPPTIATATKTTVNSVAVGVATQATKLLSKTSKLFDVIEKSYPRDLKAKSPPPVNAVKPYVDLNCVATKLAAFEIKEASVGSKFDVKQNESSKVLDIKHVSRNEDVSTKVLDIKHVSRNEDVSSKVLDIKHVSRNEDVSSKTLDIKHVSRNEDVSSKVLEIKHVSRNEDVSSKILDIKNVSSKILDIKEISKVSTKDNKQVSKHEDVSTIDTPVSSVEVLKTEERRRTSVASQASESTPILRLESPGSSSDSECALPASPKPAAATSDAASQTEEDQQQQIVTVSPAPLSPTTIREPEITPIEIHPAPSPTLSQSRVALREEEECQQLSRDLVSQLSPSDRLLTILAPVTEPKKVTDYVSGLFRLDIRPQRPSSRLAVSPQPSESPPASPSNLTPPIESSAGSTVAPLPADSAYFTTSESKARFLTQYCEDISAPSISASEDLQRKKEELVSRLGRKLSVLREEQLVLNEETELNEALGASLQERLRGADRPTEAAKLAHHVEEVGKVTLLLLSLSGRLARAENAIMGLALCDEKRILEGKRDKLAEQLAEATQLKSSIDRRSAAVSALLGKALDSEAAADFEHFVHMKASLQVESRELADRVRLGEEQLSALRETLHS